MHNNAPLADTLDERPASPCAPASPCTKVCRIDTATGYCLGCWRTGAEIGAWPAMDAAEQHALLRQLAARRWG
ncbi:DUF1289 domain-containing protein [Ferrovibrio sp.]|uniref:DUF1289 domain-containing protein n=1 Tax=Ferrovibrio sp. TaxID=1917215 RepID=UPI0025BB7A4B|nr:DUF1289 domain-containing protein [Ferrovibrio sp.]MBX3453326.1 DUF1289 domain-containing protein [Ferrovibrio sp.]